MDISSKTKKRHRKKKSSTDHSRSSKIQSHTASSEHKDHTTCSESLVTSNMAPSGEANATANVTDTGTPLTDDYAEHVRPFIDLIDKLRAYGLDQDVSLPAVAVIGDQSAGKSSALEAISGIQLPRGSGIVTRCPLVLRLKSTVQGDKEWAAKIQYKDCEGEDHIINIDRPDEVGDKVREAQNRIAGEHKGISEDLITLDVECQRVPDLTLIDLPGITRVAVEGQPHDIGDQIKKLIINRIKQQETIILAVIPANVDIATTEAIKLAQEFDPEGERTLGVITKPDLIDQGTESELIATVTNQTCPLQKGYTLVKCRGQKNINDGQSLAEALQEEEEFFANASHFDDVDRSLLGVRNLSKKLTHELVNQIRNTIPHLQQDVEYKIGETRTKLTDLGTALPESKAEKLFFLIRMLNEFTDRIKETSVNELFTQTREAFQVFMESVSRVTPDTNDRAFLKKIEEESAKNRGKELPRFLNYRVCENLIKDVIKRYKKPADQCLKTVKTMVEANVNSLADKHFMQFPKLKGEIKVKVNAICIESFKTCTTRIAELFDMEALIYTQDRIYNHDLDAVKEKRRRENSGKQKTEVSKEQKAITPTETLALGHQIASCSAINVKQENDKAQDAEDMYEMIKAYLEISTRRLVDNIPLSISLHLIYRLSDEIRLKIISLAAESECINMVREEREVLSKRDALQKKLDRLELAQQELVQF